MCCLTLGPWPESLPGPGPPDANTSLGAAPGLLIASSGVPPGATGTHGPTGMFMPTQLAFILQNMPAAMPPTQALLVPSGPSSAITLLSFL